MKCPKCGYLGFEDVDRCRNCGYDFSLISPTATPELPIREAVDPSPLEDLALMDRTVRIHEPPPAAGDGPDLDALLGAPPAVEPSLFGPPIADDVPLITTPSPPRAPLAVRRATPEVPRMRAEPRAPTLDFAPEPDARTPKSVPARDARVMPPAADAGGADAGLGARLTAVVIDLAILALVDLVVLYFTVQICGLSMADLHLLPRAPFVAFLLVQNGGYLVAFTAGGQTLGKMAAGIRVVGAGPGDTVDLGRAAMRELLWLLLAVPAGLGFLTAFLTADHRALHDRFAGTRVVRATA